MIAALGATILAAGCEKEPVEQPPVVRPVKIAIVGLSDTRPAREFPGTIKATQNAELGFEVDGRIIERRVNEGQRVKRGDELARLDDRDYQARLDQADAKLRKAQADLDRSERIYEQNPGAISKGQIVTSEMVKLPEE